jgi:hypothetical protein
LAGARYSFHQLQRPHFSSGLSWQTGVVTCEVKIALQTLLQLIQNIKLVFLTHWAAMLPSARCLYFLTCLLPNDFTCQWGGLQFNGF